VEGFIGNAGGTIINQKPSFTVLLDASLHSFFYETTIRVVKGGVIRHQQPFFSIYFSLSSPKKSHSPCKILKLSFNVLRFQLQSLFFLFLFFVLSSFIKF
jgi:hypothetical protein